MNSLQEAVKIVFEKCLAVKPGEKVAIITDKEKEPIADAFAAYQPGITKLLIPISDANGEEPPKEIADAMIQHDVLLLITKRSLTHTTATNVASKTARIASMPGITQETAKRTLAIDYEQLAKINSKLAEILTRGNQVTLTTKLGTNLSFSIARRTAKPDTGILTYGMIGNLPAGEVFLAPVEGTANGKLIIDASMAGIGKLQEPLEIHIKEGLISEVKGKYAEQFNQKLLSNDHRNVAELGIGTNPKAIITGSVLEDEKVLGTCHIAFGNNSFFGGKVNVPFHVDGVITAPTMIIDNKTILDCGKLLI
ncbi:MAG: aminopeptidase [Nanoarchaeota archaeon]|nr:aminopeptidase [Nanoarchaeota archaeon]